MAVPDKKGEAFRLIEAGTAAGLVALISNGTDDAAKMFHDASDALAAC